MVNDMHKVVRQCHSCTQNGSQVMPRRKIQLFQAGGPLEVVLVDILGSLMKAMTVNKHVDMVTDRFSILSRTILTAKTN